MILEVNQQIKLCEIKMQDAAVIFNTIDQQRDYLGQWLPFIAHTKVQADTENFIKAVSNVPYDQKELIFTIWYNDDFAGLVGFKATDRANSKTEIGYWLSEPFQKKGIVLSCVRYLSEYAFTRLGINRIQIKCASGNKRSKRIPEKLGFIFEGIERAGERVNEHTYFDLEVFSLLRSDNV
ncbi:GNAT family N-acetyltransferase [Carboxylicivirga sp. RSCT41]|uniref:GNAT family N-acetyltransferase n=1 Tax=Carboxylicivirga agarovorans TaxID=3417570 RepID=UPI003D32CE8E